MKRKPGEMPDRLAQLILLHHGCLYAGDDGSGLYQRWVRPDGSGVVYWSAESQPWMGWMEDERGRMTLRPAFSLLHALSVLRVIHYTG